MTQLVSPEESEEERNEVAIVETLRRENRIISELEPLTLETFQAIVRLRDCINCQGGVLASCCEIVRRHAIGKIDVQR